MAYLICICGGGNVLTIIYKLRDREGKTFRIFWPKCHELNLKLNKPNKNETDLF